MLFPNGRWLMCAPDFYDVTYEINPWMSVSRAPLKKRARGQWQKLHHTILRLGGWVDYVNPVVGQPDMVFTANAGLVIKNEVVLSKFRYPQRQGEEGHFRNWFESNGYKVFDLGGAFFEGEGDALFSGDKLFVGYPFRSDKDVAIKIKDRFKINSVISCELVDPYFYHLDTCFAPLDSSRAIYFSGAFSEATIKTMKSEIELFDVPLSDAKKFACNAVIIGKDVVIPAGCPDTSALLKKLGYNPYEVELDEFIKAGGAAKCLTLRI